MNLHLHESLLLLGLDDEKGSFTVDSSYFGYGFAAALVMDLILAERIIIEDGRIKKKTNAMMDSKLLNDVLRRIVEAKKSAKVSNWLHKLVQLIGKLQPQAIDNLIRQNILERKEEKVMWVFKVNRYPTVNLNPENELRTRLRQIIFEEAEPNPKERMLLSLLLSSQVYKEFISDKEQRKIAKEKIKSLTENSKMRKILGEAITEMEVMLMITINAAI